MPPPTSREKDTNNTWASETKGHTDTLSNKRRLPRAAHMHPALLLGSRTCLTGKALSILRLSSGAIFLRKPASPLAPLMQTLEALSPPAWDLTPHLRPQSPPEAEPPCRLGELQPSAQGATDNCVNRYPGSDDGSSDKCSETGLCKSEYLLR